MKKYCPNCHNEYKIVPSWQSPTGLKGWNCSECGRYWSTIRIADYYFDGKLPPIKWGAGPRYYGIDSEPELPRIGVWVRLSLGSLEERNAYKNIFPIQVS